MTTRQPPGFTLLEMLVVLMITALLSTLLIQALGHVLQLRAGFVSHLEAVQHGALPEHWFRHSTAGLIPDYPAIPHHVVFFQAGEAYVFHGNADEFGGLTLNALDGDPGVPLPFAWQLIREEQRTVLAYQTLDGGRWELMDWDGDSGRFEYVDHNGASHEQWPPPLPPPPDIGNLPAHIMQQILAQHRQQHVVPQLPEAVILHGVRNERPFFWLVPIPGLKDPKPDARLWIYEF